MFSFNVQITEKYKLDTLELFNHWFGRISSVPDQSEIIL